MRLVGIVANHYSAIDGELAFTNGIDILDLPMDRFLNLAWHYATRHAEDENALRKFEAKLWQPPKGEVGQGVWSAEAETAAFAAFTSQINGGPAPRSE